MTATAVAQTGIRNHLRLWIKFRKEHALNESGVSIHRNYFKNDKERLYYLARYKAHIFKLEMNEKIWQAKIFEHPENKLIFSFSSKKQDYYDAENKATDK